MTVSIQSGLSPRPEELRRLPLDNSICQAVPAKASQAAEGGSPGPPLPGGQVSSSVKWG